MRTRVLSGQVLLLLLVCLGIGTATELALRSYLYHQLDGQVRDVAARSALLSALPPPRPDMLRELGHHAGPGPSFLDSPGQPVGLVTAVIESDGTLSAGVLARNGQQQAQRRALSDTARDQIAAVQADHRPVTVNLDGLGDYRLMTKPDRLGRTTISGLPTADIEATMLRVLWIFVLASVIALVAAIVLGVLVTRRALAPLNRMAATARRVAGLPLDRGEVELPVRVPGNVANANTEVGQMGSALNRMLDHISTALSTRQASETRVRQFVADASHELRTPLTAIRGYTELAQRRSEEMPPEVAHAIGRVASEADRMTHLVEDLLLLARLDSGRPLEAETVDLSLLAVDAVSDAHIAGGDHTWNLDLPEVPVQVTGDALRLHQVLANLLANARTHTPPGTVVTVSLAQDDGGAVLTVADDGPGIPVELQSEVFERFARGDSSRSRKDGSTGLGLAIVSAVVRAHHGSITLASTPGDTVFTVRLPYAPGPPATNPGGSASVGGVGASAASAGGAGVNPGPPATDTADA
ncbi:two-component sensor histidine kinase [Mycolicibacterium insubricum]|nr:two-component sensor histidine kinase [Mycolicibacterium insubricum]